jgi:exodeoxyribonuclease VII large subunit
MRLAATRGRLQILQLELGRHMQQRIEVLQSRWSIAARTLDAVSPLATLQRGYAIVTDAGERVLTDAARAKIGSQVHARLAQGRLIARVEAVEPTQ